MFQSVFRRWAVIRPLRPNRKISARAWSDQRQHDHISKKGFAANGGAGHRISIEKNDNRNDNRCSDRYIQAMPQRSDSVSSCEIFMKIGESKIGQGKLAAFEETHLEDGRQGKKHKEAQNQADKNRHRRNNETIDFHPCSRNLVLCGYVSSSRFHVIRLSGLAG